MCGVSSSVRACVRACVYVCVWWEVRVCAYVYVYVYLYVYVNVYAVYAYCVSVGAILKHSQPSLPITRIVKPIFLFEDMIRSQSVIVAVYHSVRISCR